MEVEPSYWRHKSSSGKPKVAAGIFKNKSEITRVAVVHPAYGYERVSYGLPMYEYEYITAKTLPLHRLLDRRGSFFKHTPIVLDNSANLIHTWNAIPLSFTPFVVSFENELPRYLGNPSKALIELGCKLLSSDRCKAILALSEVASELATNRFDMLGHSEIVKKIQVFRGGVRCKELTHEYDFGLARRKLKILFIGAVAMPKGIIPSLHAMRQLAEEGYEIEFHFVGHSTNNAGYVLKRRASAWDKIVNESHEFPWLNHHGTLTPDQIKSLMNECDVLLFPSLDESLGWVTIEASLSGIPSIVTNIFALPELVINEETGYVIDLDLNDRERRWAGVFLDGQDLDVAIENAYRVIDQRIKEVIKSIFDRPALLETLGRKAYQHILGLYEVNQAAEKLTAIYKRSIK